MSTLIHPSLLSRFTCRTLYTPRSQAYRLSQLTRHHAKHSRPFSSSSPLTQRWPPTPTNQRPSFWDRIPHDTLFYGIIGLNGLVFGMWYMAQQKLQQTRDPSAAIWMYNNFTDSWKNITSGRVWTLVTTCFSHQDVSHILFNGFTFYFMARPVLNMLGNKNFLLLYLGGGMLANVATLAWRKIVKGQDYPSLGASAAIYSVVSFLACSAPKLTFYFYAIIPIPAWAAVAGIFAYDSYSAVTGGRKGVDTVGHIAGLMAGAGFFLLRRFRMF